MRSISLLGDAARSILLCMAFSLTQIADAGAFDVTQEQRAACAPDAFRLCGSEIPNVNRVTACMDAKKARLSPSCRAVFEASDSQAPQHHASDRSARYHRWHRRHNARYQLSEQP